MFKSFEFNDGVKVTLAGAVANIFLSVVKFIGGVLGKSTAMIADSLHSLSDLLTDVVTLLTHQIGQIPKDEDHPYGHGKAENIGGTIIGVVIMLVGLGMIYEVWKVIDSGRQLIPEWVAAGSAVLSIVVKEGLFHYTKKVGEKYHSPSIIANAWHHRSDAISSVAAFIGILGAMYGYPIMDPLAGGVVGLLIIWAGSGIFRGGMRDIMDTALEEDKVKRVEEIIQNTPGVLRSHDLRTRRIGGKILMDVHILVDTDITVTEGHNIAEGVRRKLFNTLDNLEDVLVHVDAEDDTEIEFRYEITRQDLEKLIEPIINSFEGVSEHSRMRVNFLKGKCIIEVYVKVDSEKSLEETQKILDKLKTRLKTLQPVDEAKVFLDTNEGSD